MPCIRIQPRARLVAGSQGSRWRLPVLALLASVLLTGCVVRIAYGQLEWLTRWSVESYLDLNDGQERLVREIIGRNLAWHRATELPQYAAYLRELRASAVARPRATRSVQPRHAAFSHSSSHISRSTSANGRSAPAAMPSSSSTYWG